MSVPRETVPLDPERLRRLEELELTPRMARLRDLQLRAMPEVCIERPRLLTRFAMERSLLGKPSVSVLEQARLLRSVLESRAPVVAHASARLEQGGEIDLRREPLPLFAGSSTSRFKGVPLYPEFLALALWPELDELPRRRANPYFITRAEIDELNDEIFPRWVGGHVGEVARARGRSRPSRIEDDLFANVDLYLLSKLSCISHTIPDFSRVLKRGLLDLADEARRRGREARGSDACDLYAAFEEALLGVVSWSRRLSAEARKRAAAEPDAARRRELEDLAEVHARVPAEPARTFREGLAAIWTCWNAILLENANYGLSLGRLDQLLAGLYHADVVGGRLGIERGLELACGFWLALGDHVPAVPGIGEEFFGATGSNQAVTLGGVDAEGRCAVNELSHLFLRATELMRLRDPNVACRYHPEVNAPDWLRRLCRANLRTGATPAIHNDRAVIRALTARGDTPEQARDYGIVGCVEPASAGRAYGHSAAILLNLVSVLDLAMFRGRRRAGGPVVSLDTGDPAGFSTFDEFRDAFAAQIDWAVERTTSLNDLLGSVHQDLHPTPVLSSLFEGPMEKGLDLSRGGAVINSSGAAIIGFADVVDSLGAIQSHVFDRRTVGFAELRDALLRDFAGDSVLHALLVRSPRYGSDDPVAHGNATWLLRRLDRAFGARTTYRGGRYRVGYWTMTTHVGWGSLAGALPSGRRAGTPFASGITPTSGAVPCIATSFNALAALPADAVTSGMAHNAKFTPHAGPRCEEDLAATVNAFFDDDGGRREGGMEVQFTILLPETLADALAHPERHGDLLIRVSGYTAYLRDLGAAMRREILERTAFALGAQGGEALTLSLAEEQV